MTEPNDFEIPKNLKNILLMAWVAVLTAIVVTIIDWKIKNDILHLSQQYLGSGNDETKTIRRPNSGGVRRVPRMDSDPGMEKGNVVTEVQTDSREGEGARWDEFPPVRGESVSREARDTRPVSEGTVFVPHSDNE